VVTDGPDSVGRSIGSGCEAVTDHADTGPRAPSASITRAQAATDATGTPARTTANTGRSVTWTSILAPATFSSRTFTMYSATPSAASDGPAAAITSPSRAAEPSPASGPGPRSAEPV